MCSAPVVSRSCNDWGVTKVSLISQPYVNVSASSWKERMEAGEGTMLKEERTMLGRQEEQEEQERASAAVHTVYTLIQSASLLRREAADALHCSPGQSVQYIRNASPSAQLHFDH